MLGVIFMFWIYSTDRNITCNFKNIKKSCLDVLIFQLFPHYWIQNTFFKVKIPPKNLFLIFTDYRYFPNLYPVRHSIVQDTKFGSSWTFFFTGPSCAGVGEAFIPEGNLYEHGTEIIDLAVEALSQLCLMTVDSCCLESVRLPRKEEIGPQTVQFLFLDIFAGKKKKNKKSIFLLIPSTPCWPWGWRSVIRAASSSSSLPLNGMAPSFGDPNASLQLLLLLLNSFCSWSLGKDWTLGDQSH